MLHVLLICGPALAPNPLPANPVNALDECAAARAALEAQNAALTERVAELETSTFKISRHSLQMNIQLELKSLTTIASTVGCRATAAFAARYGFSP